MLFNCNYRCCIIALRFSQATFFPVPTQIQRTQRGSSAVLRWSVEVTTSSYSMDNWGNSTHLCSWYTSVYTTFQLDDPLLKRYCDGWRQ